jgi:hypothetical protein
MVLIRHNVGAAAMVVRVTTCKMLCGESSQNRLSTKRPKKVAGR